MYQNKISPRKVHLGASISMEGSGKFGYDLSLSHIMYCLCQTHIQLCSCGKTYCMDLFFNSLPSTVGKQKVHFHKFMLNIHKRMHKAKMIKNLQGDEVIDYVMQSTAAQGKILCFDEFQVTDVADGKQIRLISHSLSHLT